MSKTHIEIRPSGFGFTVFINGRAVCVVHTREQAERIAFGVSAGAEL